MPHEQIARLLDAQGIAFTLHEHAPLRTVADMEEHLPFAPASFLKTLAFKIKNSFWVLAAMRGQAQIDYRKLAAAFGISRSHILRPTPEEVLETLGYEQGGVAPIPLARPDVALRVVFDTDLLTLETVYCGGGSSTRTLEIRLDDLMRLVQPATHPLVRDAE